MRPEAFQLAMQEQLARELLLILRAVKILPPDSLSFAGQVSSVCEADLEGNGDFPLRRAMVQHLGRQLYLYCYSRKFTGVISDVATTLPAADEQFLKELSSANTSREYLDRGWRILRQLPTGHYVAEKNGLTRILFTGEFISHSDFRGPVQEGTNISIYCPRESKTMHPGFYYIFGESVGDQQDDSDLLRLYWNIRATGAVSLVRLLSERLNRFQLPFRLKVVNNPVSYDRSDAAVLYLNTRYFRVGGELIADVHNQIAYQLNVDTPLFSKNLRPGLGLAEEPTTGESFGQQRCRLLAEAIWNVYELSLTDEHQQLGEIKKRFEVNGMSLDRPYLNPGSIGTYDFPTQSY